MNYMEKSVKLDTVVTSDNVEFCKGLSDDSIDMVVTSPPYERIRIYIDSPYWDFKSLAKELYRVLKPGGVCFWVVGDQVVKGSESLTSFKQAIFFVEEAGFLLHDTIIYHKENYYAFPDPTRYWQHYEYCFVLSKGQPSKFNPIMEESKRGGAVPHATHRKADGTMGRKKISLTGQPVSNQKKISNVWSMFAGYGHSAKDRIAHEHPAIFPEKLAERAILSWSNENDVILDPFMGGGTTAKMCLLNGRHFIGCDISQKYVDITNRRIEWTRNTIQQEQNETERLENPELI